MKKRLSFIWNLALTLTILLGLSRYNWQSQEQRSSPKHYDEVGTRQLLSKKPKEEDMSGV
jgi:hypothetical protein